MSSFSRDAYEFLRRTRHHLEYISKIKTSDQVAMPTKAELRYLSPPDEIDLDPNDLPDRERIEVILNQMAFGSGRALESSAKGNGLNGIFLGPSGGSIQIDPNQRFAKVETTVSWQPVQHVSQCNTPTRSLGQQHEAAEPPTINIITRFFGVEVSEACR